VADNEVTVEVGERFHVASGDILKADLDARLGGDVTRIETIRPMAANGGRNGRPRKP
jgi:hypothetical protein